MPDNPAKVTIGEWNWTDNEALFIRQNDGGSRIPAIWADYQIRNRYEGDKHVYMMGGTSPDGYDSQSNTVSFVQLAAPTLLWITDFTAARFNIPPTVPDPDPDNDEWVLLDVHFETPNIVVPADGQSPYYRVSGTYYYGHKKPPVNPLAAMCFPRPPWLKDFPSRTLDSSKLFEEGLNTLKGSKSGPNLDNPVILNRK